MVSHARKNRENLIFNGTFAESLIGWNEHRVRWVAGRARFDSAARLSQTVMLNGPGVVKVNFDISDYCGAGEAILSGGRSRHSINRAGHYEVDFTVEQGDSADLIFTAQGPFDLDNVRLYAHPVVLKAYPEEGEYSGTITCTLLAKDEEGNPRPGMPVEWSIEGFLRIERSDVVTNHIGRASCLVVNNLGHNPGYGGCGTVSARFEGSVYSVGVKFKDKT